MGHIVRKPGFVTCKTTNADKPVHPGSLISALVLRFLEGIFAKLTTYKYIYIQTFNILASPHVQINKIFERKIVNIFIPISFNIYFGCSKELSH